MLRAKALVFFTIVGLASGRAHAEEEHASLQVHGFVSQGYLKSTRNNYLGQSARPQGSFDFTEVGINFTQPLGDKLRIGLQVFARDLGPLGNYTPQLDWYYVDYRFFDWLGLRVGKTKLPWGLYNEANDVDAGRVPILLPQSLYPVANRESLFAQTGGELYGDVPLGAAGSLEYRVYGGTIFVNTAESSDALKGFEVPYEGGGRLMWRPPWDGLQLGGSAQLVRFDFDYAPTAEQREQYDTAGLLPPDFNGTISASLDAKLWVASVEYQREGLLLAAEYSRTHARYSTGLRAPVAKIVNEGGYAMASYQVASWFTPGLYYSAFFPDIHDGAQPGVPLRGRASYQHDIAATLRYDLTTNWLVKLEGHYMHGTAGLSSALNDDRPLGVLAKDWGLFLVKTTGYF